MAPLFLPSRITGLVWKERDISVTLPMVCLAHGDDLNYATRGWDDKIVIQQFCN